jgi:RNA methyltransferase, TrmH family
MNAGRRRRGDAHSYALGHWPALEALRHRPEAVDTVLLHPDLPARWRDALVAAAERAAVAWRVDARGVEARRHRGDAAALALLRTFEDRLERDADHVVLVAPSHPGNVGVVMRAALGFDVRDLALVTPGVDPWSPHVLRASQGTRFALRVASFPGWDEYLEAAGERALVAFAPPATEVGSVPLQRLRLPRPEIGASLAFVAINTWLLYYLINVARVPPLLAGAVFVAAAWSTRSPTR